MNRAAVDIGDPVEVKAMIRSPYKREPEEQWLPGRVTRFAGNDVVVQMDDGDRVAVPFHCTGWRLPR